MGWRPRRLSSPLPVEKCIEAARWYQLLLSHWKLESETIDLYADIRGSSD